MALTYNTVTTPRGRQFSLVLPDGSRIWLNAASSIKFPTAFTGKERRVELAGEAYFEVAKDKNKPFFVHTDNTETEVLGTSFNISAYNDESVVGATLIEGSIRTGLQTDRRTGSQTERVKLVPGEQAKMGVRVEVDHHADVEQVMAWKNGAFNFGNMGLKEVMRQLARWYDLDVVYEPGVKDFRFGGEMSRNVPLSSLLKGLKDMEVHFRIENDHKLVVMP
jgi:ferric-dicitrate binding protein FerR (iron transport regulator)